MHLSLSLSVSRERDASDVVVRRVALIGGDGAAAAGGAGVRRTIFHTPAHMCMYMHMYMHMYM